MFLLFELLPILAFFIAYKLAGVYAATLVTMVLASLLLTIDKIQRKSISFMKWLNMLLIGLMGGATLFFQNIWFIKWKPTLVYWLLALVCLYSAYFRKRPITQSILGEAISLSDRAWEQLNRYWIGFFGGLGLLNIAVAYQVDTDAWVSFKLFGLSSLTLLFAIIQAIYFLRTRNHHEY